MKWIIAGLLFALAVGLAVATAAIRADNVVARRNVEQQYQRINDRIRELSRLSYERRRSLAPERLAEMHDEWLRRDSQRRREQVQ